MSLHFYPTKAHSFLNLFRLTEVWVHTRSILIEWKHSRVQLGAMRATSRLFQRKSSRLYKLLVTHKPEIEKQVDFLEDSAAQKKKPCPHFLTLNVQKGRCTIQLLSIVSVSAICLKYASLRLGKSNRKSPLNYLISDHAHELATKIMCC